jgi:hypothetical protein
MITRHARYRGCSVFATAVSVAGTGHFIITLEIEMGSLGTFNAPIACRPFQNAADALESTLTTAHPIVDTIMGSVPTVNSRTQAGTQPTAQLLRHAEDICNSQS